LGRVLRVPADFGVHPMTLSKWLWKAYVEDGMKPELALDGIPVTVAAGTSGPIRVTSRAELAAVVRYLLGFQPEQSLVLLPMQQRRLGFGQAFTAGSGRCGRDLAGPVDERHCSGTHLGAEQYRPVRTDVQVVPALRQRVEDRRVDEPADHWASDHAHMAQGDTRCGRRHWPDFDLGAL
jgi:hypothetical protein